MFRVSCFGFRVSCFGSMVSGFGFRVDRPDVPGGVGSSDVDHHAVLRPVVPAFEVNFEFENLKSISDLRISNVGFRVSNLVFGMWGLEYGIWCRGQG